MTGREREREREKVRIVKRDASCFMHKCLIVIITTNKDGDYKQWELGTETP